jgi:hypothetical protein
VVETEDGEKVRFFSREGAVRDLVVAAMKTRTTVSVTPERRREVRRIVLRAT